MALELRQSKIHSMGCYTTTPITAGEQIIEYNGPRLTPNEANEFYEDDDRTYLFALDCGRYVIDGFGRAAFVNHSCEPNCETDEIDGRVWIIAMRDIAAGEELTYDYNLFDGEDDDESKCACGARTCRGTLYSEEEMARRAKAREATAA
jgi:SET domain-containing protein